MPPRVGHVDMDGLQRARVELDLRIIEIRTQLPSHQTAATPHPHPVVRDQFTALPRELHESMRHASLAVQALHDELAERATVLGSATR